MSNPDIETIPEMLAIALSGSLQSRVCSNPQPFSLTEMEFQEERAASSGEEEIATRAEFAAAILAKLTRAQSALFRYVYVLEEGQCETELAYYLANELELMLVNPATKDSALAEMRRCLFAWRAKCAPDRIDSRTWERACCALNQLDKSAMVDIVRYFKLATKGSTKC